jgi:mannose-6-phosphate isomerase-like protein (cupin superfamily)
MLTAERAEETIVVLGGRAEVTVGDERAELGAGGLALVPEGIAHEVRSTGDAPLRFVGLYASVDVVTRYETEVQPDGGHERRPLGE